MGSLLQGFMEGRRQKATLQTAEDRQNAANSGRLATELAIADVAAHRTTLAQFYWTVRKNGDLQGLIPDIEFVCVAVHRFRSVVLAKSTSMGWFHVEWMGKWYAHSCSPVAVGERTHAFGYHLVECERTPSA